MEQVEGFVLQKEWEPEAGVLLLEGSWESEPVLLMPRHGRAHQIPPHRLDHERHVRTLQRLGVEAVFATAAVGSLRSDWGPGTLVVLSDFLDFTRRIYTLYDQEVIHTDFNEPFSPRLRQALLAASHGEQIPVQPEGVYVSAPGPRYETPAEVRMFRLLGGDVIGMTVAPEAILFKEAGIPYAAVAVVTNLGTGLSLQPLAHEEVTQVVQCAQEQLMRLFIAARRHLSLHS